MPGSLQSIYPDQHTICQILIDQYNFFLSQDTNSLPPLLQIVEHTQET